MNRKRSRIIIADVNEDVAISLMCAAFHLGMTGKTGYVWFLPLWLNKSWFHTTYHNDNLNMTCKPEDIIEVRYLCILTLVIKYVRRTVSNG